MSQKIITLFTILFCLSLSINTSNAQIKTIHLEDISSNYGTNSFNLFQEYDINKKGKLTIDNYSFIGTDEIEFGRNIDFLIQPSVEVPFSKISVSLDNSTVVGGLKDTLYIYDVATARISNQFIVKNIKRTKTNNDGSIAFIDVGAHVKIVDTNTGNILQEIECNIESWDLSSNGRYLALNTSSSVSVYDLWEAGDPYVYNSQNIKKKKQSTSEYIWDIKVTSNGLLAMTQALKGKIKKDFVKIQQYTITDVKTGNEIWKFKIDEDDNEWYLYSIDPTGQVLNVRDKFYDIKTKKELKVVRTGESKKGKKFTSWKFHPHIPGVYHAERGEGVNGFYSFE